MWLLFSPCFWPATVFDGEQSQRVFGTYQGNELRNADRDTLEISTIQREVVLHS